MHKTDFFSKGIRPSNLNCNDYRSYRRYTLMDYSKLKLSIILFILNISFGIIGYCVLENMGIFDALYMTIITLSTAGFSEIKPFSQGGRIITLLIIITGIGVGTYTLGQVFRIFVEGELRLLLGRRKLDKTISGLKNHWIVCGFGRIGKIISRELAADKMKFAVIDQNTSKIEELEQQQHLSLNMDATTEEALMKDGIQLAKGIVTAVRSDANNVFITLSVKAFRPDIFVLSRISDVKMKASC